MKRIEFYNSVHNHFRKIDGRKKAGKLDDDAYADALRIDVSTCCTVKSKTSSKRRRAADSSGSSAYDDSTDDDAWTRRKKPKTKANENSKKDAGKSSGNPVEKSTGKKASDVALSKIPSAIEVGCNNQTKCFATIQSQKYLESIVFLGIDCIKTTTNGAKIINSTTNSTTSDSYSEKCTSHGRSSDRFIGTSRLYIRSIFLFAQS